LISLLSVRTIAAGVRTQTRQVQPYQ
jgi:hypothetical protein